MICTPSPSKPPAHGEGFAVDAQPGSAAGVSNLLSIPLLAIMLCGFNLDIEGHLTLTLSPLSSQTLLAPVIIFLVPRQPPNYVAIPQA